MKRLSLLLSINLLFFNTGFSVDHLKLTAMADPVDSVLVKYTAYNLWANQQFASWLAESSEELLDMEIESSFNTIRKTLIHIWNAEYVWLKALKNEEMDEPPGKSFEGSKEALFEGLLQQSQDFHQYVSAMDRGQLNGSRMRSNGREFSVADMIHHCMNHSTYHRGQLVTMGRQAGLKNPPRTDLIYYTGLDNK